MTKTTEDTKQRINEGREQHDFGVVDNKGRAVGANVAFAVITFVEIPADSRSWSSIEPGTYFAWWANATRAEEMFGACQNWRYCKTEAERVEQVEKYLKAAKARAAKNFD